MSEALIKTLQAEYAALIQCGASEPEAIEQVGISLELHPEIVQAFINY